MELIDAVTAYVAMQRSLGLRFEAADRLGSVGIRGRQRVKQ
jgi:hypothetical protein